MKSKFGDTPEAETPQAPETPDTESLKGWYLLRGFDAAHGPMASLMDLPEKDAIAKMKEIHPHRGAGPADENGHRPQETYYARRRDADNWLRDFADAADIARDRKNPTFFALTNDYEKVREAMAKGSSSVIAMPLEKADLSQWTFTAGDSMGNYLSKQNVSAFLTAEHALTGTAMDAHKLIDVIKKGDIPKDAFEAQYWSSKPLPAEIVATPTPVQKQPAQSVTVPTKPAQP